MVMMGRGGTLVVETAKEKKKNAKEEMNNNLISTIIPVDKAPVLPVAAMDVIMEGQIPAVMDTELRPNILTLEVGAAQRGGYPAGHRRSTLLRPAMHRRAQRIPIPAALDPITPRTRVLGIAALTALEPIIPRTRVLVIAMPTAPIQQRAVERRLMEWDRLAETCAEWKLAAGAKSPSLDGLMIEAITGIEATELGTSADMEPGPAK